MNGIDLNDPETLAWLKKNGADVSGMRAPAAAPPSADPKDLDATAPIPITPQTALPQPVTPAPAAAPAVPKPNPATSPGTLNWKSGLAMALAGLGDAFSAGGGSKNPSAANDVLKMTQDAPARAMAAQERGRTLKTQQEQDDPNSKVSQAQASLLIKLGADPTKVKGLSYTEMQPMAAITEKVYGVDAATKEKLLAAQIAAQTRKEVAETNASNRSVMLGEKTDQFNQREWDKIIKENDPNVTTSRSAIGMLGRTNLNANRAIMTLKKPTVTNQEAGNVMADIASIYQSGSPTQFGMSHQEYKSWYGKIQGLIQEITGKPQDALPNEVKTRLLGVLKDMKQTNADLMKQQLDQVEISKAKIIKHFPGEWKDWRTGLEKNFGPEADGGDTNQAGPPVIDSQEAYDKLPSGTVYVDSTGKQARKK